VATIALTDTAARPALRTAGLIQALLITCLTSLPAIAIVSLVPAIPLLLRQFSSVPNASVLVPLIVTAPGICITLLSPLAGLLADKFGRRNMVLGALVLYALAGSGPLFLDSIYAIIGSRLVLGVAESVLVTVGYALISDYYPPDERRKWLALQAALGSVIGALLTFSGGLLADISWRGPFTIYLAAIPILVASLVFLWEPTGHAEEEPVHGSDGRFPWASMAAVALLTLFGATLFYGYIIQIGITLDRLGLTDSGGIGMISGIAALAVILGAALSRWVVKLDAGVRFFIVFGVIGLGLIGIGVARSWQVAGAAAFLQQFGAGMLIPTLVAWAHSFVSFEHRNRGTGVWAASFFLGQFTCPLFIAGIRWFVPDPQLAIAALGLCSVAAALVAVALGLRGKKAYA